MKRMKKQQPGLGVLAGLAVLAAAFMAAGCGADFKYEIAGDGVKIIGYTGAPAEGKLIIPGKINGRQVTAIGPGAFMENKTFVSVTIPGSITEIGSHAFEDCPILTSVTIGANVRHSEEGDIFVNEEYWILGSANAFDGNFKDVYEANGKQAGRYVKYGPAWQYAGSK